MQYILLVHLDLYFWLDILQLKLSLIGATIHLDNLHTPFPYVLELISNEHFLLKEAFVSLYKIVNFSVNFAPRIRIFDIFELPIYWAFQKKL